MKKIIATIIPAIMAAVPALSQYNYSSASRLDSIENALAMANARSAELKQDSIHNAIWSRTNAFELGYSFNSTSTDIYNRQNAKFAVFFDLNTSYLFPKSHAWGNVVKVGLNVRWLDVDFAMYDKFTRPLQKYTYSYDYGYNGWVSDMSSSGSQTADGPNYAKFNQMTLLAGAFGVGPVVTVAPLAFMNNAASALRVSLYFHYQPTFGLNLYRYNLISSPDGNIENAKDYGNHELCTEMGYVSMMDFGGRIQWRNFGIGIEGRWGSGKLKGATTNSLYYNNQRFNSININGTTADNELYTRKFGETRIYLDFSF